MPGKHPTVELHPQLQFSFLIHRFERECMDFGKKKGNAIVAFVNNI
jgi:hypothetical protein